MDWMIWSAFFSRLIVCSKGRFVNSRCLYFVNANSPMSMLLRFAQFTSRSLSVPPVNPPLITTTLSRAPNPTWICYSTHWIQLLIASWIAPASTPDSFYQIQGSSISTLLPCHLVLHSVPLDSESHHLMMKPALWNWYSFRVQLNLLVRIVTHANLMTVGNTCSRNSAIECCCMTVKECLVSNNE